MGKLLTYELYYDKLQPYFGEKNLELQYLDTHSFALGVKTKDIIRDLENLEEMFEFSNKSKDHELFSN